MIEVAFTRCTRPTLTARAISTCTVLGFAGYALASLASSALAVAWDLTLGERIIGLFVPPIAFLVTVTIASAIVGRERIVFYQTAFTGVLASAVVAARRRACRAARPHAWGRARRGAGGSTSCGSSAASQSALRCLREQPTQLGLGLRILAQLEQWQQLAPDQLAIEV